MSAVLAPREAPHELRGVLPEELAQTLRELWLCGQFEQIVQGEAAQYVERFRTDDPDFPAADEIYSARFQIDRVLPSNPLVREAFRDYIRPAIMRALGIVSFAEELLAYRMGPGDYFRAHKDDYAGRAGFVLYLSQRWCWDWGGVLMAKRAGVMTATLPRWNTMALMDHRSESPPHFVTPVLPWAQEPRLMLVGLLK